MIYTDLHCHPLLKCFGKNNHQASTDYKNEANLFNHKPFNLWNRIIENLLTLTPYRQSDLFSAQKANACLLASSIYSPEREFFVGLIDSPFIENLVTDFGVDWIREIQDVNTSYYKGLQEQFEFIERLDGEKTYIKGRAYQYKVIQSKTDVEDAIRGFDKRTVYLLYNIEGGHNLFHTVETQQESSEKIVEGSIEYIKTKKPFYFTLAHHFYNQLSGHCLSLPDVLEKIRPQEFGSNLGLRKQGREVIEALLSKNNGPRVLIDIKHMNPRARNEYYMMLEDMAAEGDFVPLVFSHGGANGMDSFKTKNINNSLLHAEDIGLYDDEIVRLVKSEGLFGLNLDERVMSSPEALKATKKYKCPKKRFKETSGLIWNNIEQILRATEKDKISPWNCICIGSDFDGIINPVNGFWTVAYLPRLKKYIAKHLNAFLSENPDLAYGLSDDEILEKLFSLNMTGFILKHFN